MAVGLGSVLLMVGCGWSGGDRGAVSVRVSPAAFGVQDGVFRVLTVSMEPTLVPGTRVILRRGAPVVGAIVVFHPPEGILREKCGPTPHVVKAGGAACDAPVPGEAKVELIKRVVAGPGERIYIRGGHVYREVGRTGRFRRERAPYARACGHHALCNYPVPITIPAGHWFLMGDNRGMSLDSRSYGPVPRRSIVGLAAGLECPRFAHRITWVRRSWREGCSRPSRR